MGLVPKVDSPNTIAEPKMFIGQQVSFARNGWVGGQIAYSRNRPRYSSRRGHSPENHGPSPIGEKYNFFTIRSPGGRGEPGVVKGNPTRFPTCDRSTNTSRPRPPTLPLAKATLEPSGEKLASHSSSCGVGLVRTRTFRSSRDSKAILDCSPLSVD